MELTASDLRIESFRGDGWGFRVTHIPTGFTGVSHAKTYFKAKSGAIAEVVRKIEEYGSIVNHITGGSPDMSYKEFREWVDGITERTKGRHL